MRVLRPEEPVAKAIYESQKWDGFTSPGGLVSLKWRCLSEAQREPYYQMAAAAMEAVKILGTT